MASASAYARAALAGNPSDGYGGATLAVVVRDFRAEVEAELGAAPDRQETTAPELVGATLDRFERELAPGAERAVVRARTTIPRSVGLGGSSAIVIATTRALCELHDVELGPDELAAFALAVETEELGIAAGLQDRVAQAYGGLTFMDFGTGSYEPLDPALLPPLVLAWNEEAAGDSGLTHGDLRARHAAGEPAVHEAMTELAGVARQAREALTEGDGAAFAACLDASFNARQRMMSLDGRHVRMIELARALGAGANYTGSGGAIVGACADAEHRDHVVEALRAAGFRAIAPRVCSRGYVSRPPLSTVTRRVFVLDGAAALAVGAVAHATGTRHRRRTARLLARPTPAQAEALDVLGRSTLRLPGSRPYPDLPPGTDTMPGIEHVVVCMLENHSYDNLFGMLGRGAGQSPRGDGFTLGADGLPTATNPYADGTLQRAFHMPTTCQLSGKPSQEWAQCHVQFDGGKNDGFVVSQSGPVAMGYWTGQDLPFTYDLASKFPVGDRWFCSLLGQTDPNRSYLIAATSTGMTDDIGGTLGDLPPDISFLLPSAGMIFTRLDDHGISWRDYYTTSLAGATAELCPVLDTVATLRYAQPIAQFFTDAAAGSLPAFSLLDPDYSTKSQENPQNMVVGEAFLAKVVQALGTSPNWAKTLLVFTYDEHGGYYDHVPPPVALAPDAVGPIVRAGQSTYDGFHRYGFRVPAVIVSPYAKRDYVSHVVHDHTSILALLERKWNLPALTYRDANANDLTDFLDLDALEAGTPTFPSLPSLAAPDDTPAALACSTTGPGTIPPPAPAAATRPVALTPSRQP